MSTGYSALEEIKEPLAPEQLRVLRDQINSEHPNPSPQSQFNYGWGLIKSNQTRQQQEGVVVLRRLYKDVPSMRRECLYYLSLSSFKLGEYSSAKTYVDLLIKDERDNQQALQLRDAIEEKVTRDGLIGIGIAGGVVAIGIGLLSAALRKKR